MAEWSQIPSLIDRELGGYVLTNPLPAFLLITLFLGGKQILHFVLYFGVPVALVTILPVGVTPVSACSEPLSGSLIDLEFRLEHSATWVQIWGIGRYFAYCRRPVDLCYTCGDPWLATGP
jgi:hypothetical protein